MLLYSVERKGMKSYTSRSQDDLRVGLTVVGALLYYGLYVTTMTGWWILTGFLSFALVIGVFWVLVQTLEVNPDTKKPRRIYCKGQSPSFMAGLPLVLPALTLNSYAYSHEDVVSPGWWSFWGFAVGVIVLVAVGIVFPAVDNKRYIECGAAPMLDSPSCWWIRYWQIPIGAGIVLSTMVPVWITGGSYAYVTAALIGLWAIVAATEIPFPPDPFVQHEMWSRFAFRVMTRKEVEVRMEAFRLMNGPDL